MVVQIFDNVDDANIIYYALLTYLIVAVGFFESSYASWKNYNNGIKKCFRNFLFLN